MDFNGKSIFDGEFLEGKKWNGKKILLDENNDVSFESQYSEGSQIKFIFYSQEKISHNYLRHFH